MTILNLMRFIMRALMIGSFIYSVNIAFGHASQGSTEVISVWIASAAIGAVSVLYTLNVPEVICVSAQVAVGLIGFTAAAVFNGWIGMSTGEMIGYALVILVLMMIIIGVQYVFAILDSKKINERLDRSE